MVRERMSDSILTTSPSRALPSVVNSRVVGMRAMSKVSGVVEAMVRLMPSMVMEPLGMMKSMRGLGGVMVRRHSPGLARILRMWPLPSMWPCTKWPPMGVEGVSEGSRLTLLPGAKLPSLLWASVSATTSKLRVLLSNWTSVRQTPLTQMESPRLKETPGLGQLERSMTRRLPAVDPPGKGESERTLPTA